MPHSELPLAQHRRLAPFDGLAIDVGAWRDAHDYHRAHQRLHTLGYHGFGIVQGLEVTAHDPPDRTVIIHPGMAIDRDGNCIIVTEPQRVALESRAAASIHIVIQYRELPTDQRPGLVDGDLHPARMLETFAISERAQLPAEPHLELARVRLRAATATIRNAQDGWRPAAEEIDARYRLPAAVRPQIDLAIGFAWSGPGTWAGWTRPLEGIHHLVQELRASGARVQTIELRGSDFSSCDLVYLVGQGQIQLGPPERQALAGFLNDGGAMLAETSDSFGREEAQEFTRVFNGLAAEVGRPIKPVEAGHPLLASHYLFNTVPPGAAATGGWLAEGDGLMLSTMDYGFAWAGGHTDRPLPRPAIRMTMEFGMNLAAYAASLRTRTRLRRASR